MHPKTGNVCVPFDPKKYEELDFKNLTTLTTCIDQLANKDSEGVVPCMRKYIDMFKKHVRACHAKQQKETGTQMEDDDNQIV